MAKKKKHNKKTVQPSLQVKKPDFTPSTTEGEIGSKHKALLQQYLHHYFEHRPAFFGLIRPQEGVLFQHFTDYNEGKVLDFGCGDGFFAEMVYGRNSIDVGLDLPGSRIEEAKQLRVYEDVVTYDGTTIPFHEDSFHTVISNCVLEHIPQVQPSIEEIYRVTKPGGHFLTGVMTNNWERFMFGPQFFGDYYRSSMRKKQEHFNLFSVETWDSRFTDAGFTIVEKVGYVNPENAKWLDLYHYLSTPSLLTHLLFKQWVLWKQWYKVIPLDQLALEHIQKSLDENNPEESSAVFYVLRKDA